MTNAFAHQPRHTQRGVAALVTSVVLLLVTALVMLYLNRSLIFEQKTSANQLRSTKAMETAEAGLEWAIGMLNYTQDIGANCQAVAASSTTFNFRKLYVQTYWGRTTLSTADQAYFGTTGGGVYYDDTTAVVPVRHTFPGCKINGSTLTCTCPLVDRSALAIGAGGVPSDPASAPPSGAELPAFTVAFAPVPAAYPPADAPNMTDPMAVLVTVTGCTATTGNCAPGTLAGSVGVAGPDAVASVSAIVKLRPLLRAGPAAALTCGRTCAPGGSLNIVNTDPSTNGVTINSGSTSTVAGGAQTVTMPGLPPANSQIQNDESLSTLANADDSNCSNSEVFKAYFGSSIEDYRAAATEINCSSAANCGSLLMAEYNNNKRNFYFPNGLTLNNSSGLPGNQLGGPGGDAVTLVTNRGFDINGNISVYGVLFSNDATFDYDGSGNGKVYGAVVACRDQTGNGNGTIAYDPSVVRGTQRGDTATALKIPGSWTDACKLNNAGVPVRTCK